MSVRTLFEEVDNQSRLFQFVSEVSLVCCAHQLVCKYHRTNFP